MGRARNAEMPRHRCPPVYGRVRRDPQQCHGDCTLPPVRKGHNLYAHQAATVSPFPINLREPIELRRNANLNYLPPDLGHLNYAAMLISKRPILTRGQSNFAAMPFIQRLATKEIQYG